MSVITPQNWQILPESFYQRGNTNLIARQLLGKLLVTNLGGMRCAVRIVETEAYHGITDRASHAWNGRHTNRTAVMYQPGGLAYVYLCYGIHALFNVVTHTAGMPHAILLRAAEPVEGMAAMTRRTGKQANLPALTSGPGNLSKAMGIDTRHTGLSLQGNTIWLADDGFRLSSRRIAATPRIGVDYAGKDALLPYRFIIRDHPYLSGRP
ncbi:MAG TPA: DNA-3-methyladenine glycosylase [Sediminibacterium sp.]|nr:DNA-3-methyladenine glycosylase [Sediminibacterium sp.]